MTSRGRGEGSKGWLSPPGAGPGAMLEGAKHPAAFLRTSPCKDPLAPLLARAVMWPQWPLKHLMESCVHDPEHLLAPWGSRSCSAPRSSFAPSLQAPCPNQEATSTYEKTLPSYEQIQRQVVGSDPLPPTAQPRPRSCSQLAVQAKAEVHWELGGAGDPPRKLAPRLETAAGSWYVMPVGFGVAPAGCRVKPGRGSDARCGRWEKRQRGLCCSHSSDPPAPQPRWSLDGVSADGESRYQIIYQEEIWIAFGCNLHFASISFYKYKQCPSPG